jgi:hypothetical protein
MSEQSITIEIEEPYAGMIHELRNELGAETVDDDLKQLVHDATHNSYQELISEQS